MKAALQGCEAFLSSAPSRGGPNGPTAARLGSFPPHVPQGPGWWVSSRRAAAPACARRDALRIRGFYKYRSFRPLWPLMLGLWVAVGSLPSPFLVGIALRLQPWAITCARPRLLHQDLASSCLLPPPLRWPPGNYFFEVGSSLGQFPGPPKTLRQPSAREGRAPCHRKRLLTEPPSPPEPEAVPRSSHIPATYAPSSERKNHLGPAPRPGEE